MTVERWKSSARSDRGRVRDSNEDDFLHRPGDGLFAVADGMGGHAAGEVASRLAVETLEEELAGGEPGADDLPSPDRMAGAVREANRAILRDARENPERAGMGTTLTALALSPRGRWRVGHVGDSRAYLLRDGELRQLTVDHSWVGLKVARGDLTKEEARRHPMSSALERALGTSPEVEVDAEGGEARSGDLFLLCSDGLNAMLPDGDIRSLLREELPPAGEGSPAEGKPPEAGELEATAGRLVDAANRAGGDDNVTVVLVAVGP